MKALVEFLFPTIKAIIATVGFLVGLGWTAYLSVHTIVKAEGNAIRAEVRELRGNDIQHIDKRFDRLEVLIKEKR